MQAKAQTDTTIDIMRPSLPVRNTFTKISSVNKNYSHGSSCMVSTHIKVFLFFSFNKFRCRRLRPYYPRSVLALFLSSSLRLRVIFQFLFFNRLGRVSHSVQVYASVLFNIPFSTIPSPSEFKDYTGVKCS